MQKKKELERTVIPHPAQAHSTGKRGTCRQCYVTLRDPLEINNKFKDKNLIINIEPFCKKIIFVRNPSFINAFSFS